MKKSVWKFPLNIEDAVTIRMPKCSMVLDVQLQNGIPCLWALCATDSPLEDRTFFLYGTGHPIEEEDISYVGTFQIHDGALVFHLFEYCE